MATPEETAEAAWDRYTKLIEAQRAEYVAKWPNHCRSCEGWGGRGGYSTHTGCNDYDTCPQCSDNGLCPRCGQPHEDDGLAVCGSCGWEPSSGGMPQP